MDSYRFHTDFDYDNLLDESVPHENISEATWQEYDRIIEYDDYAFGSNETNDF